MTSMALTPATALRMAIEVCELLVKHPFSFAAAESNIKDNLRIRVIDAEGGREKQRYLAHDCSVHIFRALLMSEIAEMQRTLRDEQIRAWNRMAS